MQDAPLVSQQAGGVSLPRVQQYVDQLLTGDVAPAIKVDGNVIATETTAILLVGF